MNKMKKYLLRNSLIFVAVLLILYTGKLYADSSRNSGGDTDISIIPRPCCIKKGKNVFELRPDTKIILTVENSRVRKTAAGFRERLALSTGYNLDFGKDQKENCIIFQLTNDEKLGQEGYCLDIKKDKVILRAFKPPGIFYGIQTIFQLLPPEVYSVKVEKHISWKLPCVNIEDSPRFKWRGMMLDVSRHFFPKSFIKRFIDFLAMHKLNRFHWHLVDDQGWRIEIKKYPKLTEIGAWRVDREDKPWNRRDPQKEGEEAAYGGFYTQDDVKEIVKYAEDRFITIVPEIEMPAHCTSALASYPEYSCTGGPFTVLPGGVWPISDIYCAGNDSTFIFLENVLSEIMELFPGKYIHIGGDEANKYEWERCSKCQKRMKDEKLENPEQLQSYFIKRIEKFLNKNKRILIGWDEILQGGLAPRAAVMSWRGIKGGIAAAKQGHKVVFSPTSHCYFDYYQGASEYEPKAIGGYLPLRKVYSFESVPDELDEDEADYILGAQANLWTEYVPTLEHAEYMIFPRIAALSEVVWSKKENKKWRDFSRRMKKQYLRYRLNDINYSRSYFQVSAASFPDTLSGSLLITLNSEMFNPEIRYTVNGDDPTSESAIYKGPFKLKNTAVVRAGVFTDNDIAERIAERKFIVHAASGKRVKLKYPYSNKYSGGGRFGLTDGMLGSDRFSDGLWQGFNGTDFDCLLDLSRIEEISTVSMRYMRDQGAWIFLPEWVEYSVSKDGENFEVVKRESSEVCSDKSNSQIKTFKCEIDKREVRYIRVQAKNIGKCPDWHVGAGSKAWIFTDEIVIN